jgi:LysR family transcriptional regulator, glycine cleavage system transcriptional activator
MAAPVLKANSGALPSVTGLRVFLAAAAEGSASKAADRVHLTQSAVSKQLLGLEAQLGAALFERSATGLQLTEAGELFRPYAEAALEHIARGMQRVANHRQAASPIRLHMIAIAGERWLMDRFPAFMARHPDADIQFTNYVNATATEEADLTIWHGGEPESGEDSHYLFGRHVSLVASPPMLERIGPILQPGDIQRMTYLQHFQMQGFWAELTESIGLRGALPARTIRYGYLSVIIKAAVAGLGIALVPTCFVRDELAQGSLVNPLGLSFDSSSGCWLTLTHARTPVPGMTAFVDWLKQEAVGFDSGIAPG